MSSTAYRSATAIALLTSLFLLNGCAHREPITRTETIRLCPETTWTEPTPEPEPLPPGTTGALAIVDHRDAYATALRSANVDKASIREWCETNAEEE